MARSPTTNQQTLLSARGVKKCELIQIDFDTPMYLTTAGRDVTYDGHTWVGDGTLLSLGDITESLEIQSHSLQIELSGANPALVALALGVAGKGKRVRVWVAVLNATGAIDGTPMLEADDQIDTMQVIDSVT